jgi:hypothetical protein
MTKYHAVMLDETRCEFGVSVEAKSRSEAHEILREDYPESRCVQLETPAQARERERRLYEWSERLYNGEVFDDYEC